MLIITLFSVFVKAFRQKTVEKRFLGKLLKFFDNLLGGKQENVVSFGKGIVGGGQACLAR